MLKFNSISYQFSSYPAGNVKEILLGPVTIPVMLLLATKRVPIGIGLPFAAAC